MYVCHIVTYALPLDGSTSMPLLTSVYKDLIKGTGDEALRLNYMYMY